MKKQKLLSMLLILFLMVALVAQPQSLYAQSTTPKIGEYIQVGKYQGTLIVWQIVGIDGNGNYVLVSKDILAYKAFDAAESGQYGGDGSGNQTVVQMYGSNKWQTSNLREWLNSNEVHVKYSTQPPTALSVYSLFAIDLPDADLSYDQEAGFLTGFSSQEIALLASQVSGEGVNKITDQVSLISESELKLYFTDQHLTAEKKPTVFASSQTKQLTSDYYWTKSPVQGLDEMVEVINYSGNLKESTASFSKVGVVPMIKLSGSGMYLKAGTGSVSMPYTIDFDSINPGYPLSESEIKTLKDAEAKWQKYTKTQLTDEEILESIALEAEQLIIQLGTTTAAISNDILDVSTSLELKSKCNKVLQLKYNLLQIFIQNNIELNRNIQSTLKLEVQNNSTTSIRWAADVDKILSPVDQVYIDYVNSEIDLLVMTKQLNLMNGQLPVLVKLSNEGTNKWFIEIKNSLNQPISLTEGYFEGIVQKTYANQLVKGKVTNVMTPIYPWKIGKAATYVVIQTDHYETQVTTQSFKDLSGLTIVQKEAINLLSSLGIINGYKDGTFGPNKNITRAELAKMIVLANRTIMTTNNSSLKDVKLTDWYGKYVNSAYANAWITGYTDGTFKPNNNITGQEVLAIVSRTMATKGGFYYPNVPENFYKPLVGSNVLPEWVSKSIGLVAREGILSLKATPFNGSKAATRLEVVEWLGKMFESLYE